MAVLVRDRSLRRELPAQSSFAAKAAQADTSETIERRIQKECLHFAIVVNVPKDAHVRTELIGVGRHR